MRRWWSWAMMALVLWGGCRSESPPAATTGSRPAASAEAELDAGGFVHPDVSGVPDPVKPPMSDEERAVRKEIALNKQRERTRKQMEILAIGIARYVGDGTPRRLPRNLYDLVEPPAGRAPYASPEEIKDAWGNEIIFAPVGDRRYTLRSVGPDNRYGGDDDMVLER